MSCDPNTLLENSKCILSCLTGAQLDSVEVHLICRWSSTGETFHILTESGDNIAAENGDLLRTE